MIYVLDTGVNAVSDIAGRIIDAHNFATDGGPTSGRYFHRKLRRYEASSRFSSKTSTRLIAAGLYDKWKSRKKLMKLNSHHVWNTCVRAEDVVVAELGEYPIFSKLLTRRTTLPSEADHLLQPPRALVAAYTLAGCAVGVRNTRAYLAHFWNRDRLGESCVASSRFSAKTSTRHHDYHGHSRRGGSKF